MIVTLGAFFAGVVVGAYNSELIKGWVRGAWRRVAGAQKAAPASVSPTAELMAAANAATRSAPRETVSWGQALGNILAFFGGVLAWMARNPVLAIGLVLLVAFLLFGRSCSPFEFGKSRGELRLERQIAEANTRIAEHEAALGALSARLSENTARDARRVDRIIANANEELDHAVQAVDPDAVYRAYRAGYDSVWNDLSFEGGPDTDPPRTPPVRLPGAHSA